MTKSELKTGMIIVLANGREYMVYKDVGYIGAETKDVAVEISNNPTWLKLDNYNEDMTMPRYNDLDIIQVIKTPHPYALLIHTFEKEKREIIWSRKKRYTYAQLRELLGEEFEIVG